MYMPSTIYIAISQIGKSLVLARFSTLEAWGHSGFTGSQALKRILFVYRLCKCSQVSCSCCRHFGTSAKTFLPINSLCHGLDFTKSFLPVPNLSFKITFILVILILNQNASSLGDQGHLRWSSGSWVYSVGNPRQLLQVPKLHWQFRTVSRRNQPDHYFGVWSLALALGYMNRHLHPRRAKPDSESGPAATRPQMRSYVVAMTF